MFAIIEKIYINGDYVSNKEIARFNKKNNDIVLTKNQSWAKIAKSGKHNPKLAYPGAYFKNRAGV